MARTIAFVGASGIGKTNCCYSFIDWYLENVGIKQIRWLCCDGGGYQPVQDSGLIDMKLADVVTVTDKQANILSISRLIVDGYWFRKNKEGKRVISREDPFFVKPEEWEKVGVLVIDGITGLAQLMGQKIMIESDKVAFKRPYEYEEEGYTFAGSDKGHVGLIQNAMIYFLMKIPTLPCDYVVFTGLPGSGEDYKGSKQYGIQISGSAVNATCLKEINEIFHIEKRVVSIKGEDKLIRVAWFEEHKDEDTGYGYPGKTRVLAEYRDMLDEKFPNGYVPLGKKGLIKPYYNVIKEIQVKQKTDMIEKIERLKRLAANTAK